MYISRKYPWRELELLEGRGSDKEQNYSVCMTENWKFLGLGGPIKNSISSGDIDIFLNYTKIGLYFYC